MKVTLNKIRQMQPAMSRLVQMTTLPCRTTFRVCMLAKKLAEHLDACNSTNDAAVKKYGVLDEKANTWSVPSENKEAFFKEMGEFLSTEVEVSCDPIQLPGDMKGLSAADLMTMDSFVVLMEEPTVKFVPPKHGKGKNKDVA